MLDAWGSPSQTAVGCCGAVLVALRLSWSFSSPSCSSSDLSIPHGHCLPLAAAHPPPAVCETWEDDRSEAVESDARWPESDSSRPAPRAQENPAEPSSAPAEGPPQPPACPSSEEFSLPDADHAVGEDRLQVAPLHPQADRSVAQAGAALVCPEAELGSLILQHDRRQNGCLDVEDGPSAGSPGREGALSQKPLHNTGVQVWHVGGGGCGTLGDRPHRPLKLWWFS